MRGTPRRSRPRSGEPMRSASPHVPAAGPDRARLGACRHARPRHAARTRVESIGGSRRRQRERKEERRAQRHPGPELQMHEHAEQAPAAEPGTLGQVRERQREGRVLERERDPRRPAEIEPRRADGLQHDRAREGIQRIRRRGGERLASAMTPEGLPERRSAIADHDQRAGVRDTRSDRAARRHDGVVGRHVGRPDEIEPLRREPFPQLREKDRRASTSSAPLAYVVRSAPTTL